MKAGTVVVLRDGRVGTCVYNGLDGVGIKWGRYHITERDLEGSGGLFGDPPPPDYKWFPDAMLRTPYPNCDSELEYVGYDYELVPR